MINKIVLPVFASVRSARTFWGRPVITRAHTGANVMMAMMGSETREEVPVTRGEAVMSLEDAIESKLGVIINGLQ